MFLFIFLVIVKFLIDFLFVLFNGIFMVVFFLFGELYIVLFLGLGGYLWYYIK